MTEKRNINYYAVDGLIMQGEHVDVNVPIKIALDHGWSSIKGEHIFMENLVTQVDYTPLTNNGLLEYRGRKYIIGQGRLGKQATKTENDNYFLLTLAGIAKELNYQKREKTTHVELYVGVPLTMFGAERKAFREYLWHKEQLSFKFEGVHYCFYLDKVKIYAQCYAAIANRMGDMNRLRCVDLGSWTMDVLSVKDKIPMDKDAYTYEVGLITAFERIKKDGLPKVHCEIPEEDITDYIKGTSVNDEFIPIIEKGLQECVLKGPLAGYPVVGLKATLLDGSYNPVDSSEMAFKMATILAFKKGFMDASPVLLEPIVNLKVDVLDKNTGDVMGDLNKRRGRILGMNPLEGGRQELVADIPLASLIGYSTDLRSMTGGSGEFSYEFARYEQAPNDIQAKEIEARASKVDKSEE